jgi:hypothetical protein
MRIIPNGLRGRVFSTMDSVQWCVMLLSMAGAGVASAYCDPRTIGAVAGALSSTTAIFWAWANLSGRLPAALQAAPSEENAEAAIG